jgi:U5 small nuclear ribonucleoprotein component
MNSEMAVAASSCNPEGPLIVHVTKLYPDSTLTYFNALGRVMSGTLRLGQDVKVLGEHYSLEDEEDMSVMTVEGLCIGESMYVFFKIVSEFFFVPLFSGFLFS